MVMAQFPLEQATPQPPPPHREPPTRAAIVYASVAGIAIGGQLLAMMEFSFLASVAILLLSSPLLLIFSPIIIPAAFVLGASVVGCATAATMAIGGLFAFSSIVFRVCSGRRGVEKEGGVTVTLTGFGRRAKEGRKENFQHTAEVQPQPP